MSEAVAFTFSDPHVEQCFRELLAYVPNADGPAAREFSVRASRCEVSVALDGAEVVRAASALDAGFLVEQYVYCHLVPAQPDALILHAAAVRHTPSRSVLLLPGGPRSGKTTITLAALQSGRFVYLSEDCVAVDRSTFEVIPFPRPLRWRTADDPATAGMAGWRTQKLDRLPVTLLRPPARLVTVQTREPAPSLAVFPVFDSSCGAQTRSLARGELVARLLGACVNQVSTLRCGGLAQLRRLADRLAGATLAWSDGAAAVQEIESLVSKRRAGWSGGPDSP